MPHAGASRAAYSQFNASARRVAVMADLMAARAHGIEGFYRSHGS